MSLRERFLLTIECSECGMVHKFSVDSVVGKGTIYCGCGKTIIIDNVNRYGKRINELERPSHQVALSTKVEKKDEIEREEEKPKATKLKAVKPKTAKPKATKLKAVKPKTAKPKATKPKKKKTTTKKPKKEETKK